MNELKLPLSFEHEWYGPCDSMGPGRVCSECFRLLFGDELQYEKWTAQHSRVYNVLKALNTLKEVDHEQEW